ncbi:MAG: hypothetical protein K0R62_4426 [Nonomuraea muscovyensis]|nr:hypothetical protein [Nonomuraea muscovyensis]
MSVADTAANLSVYPKQRGNHGGAGYPALRLLTLLARGTIDRTSYKATIGIEIRASSEP